MVASYGLTRLMASLLYGMAATDLLTFVTVSAVLLAVGLIASYLPARPRHEGGPDDRPSERVTGA